MRSDEANTVEERYVEHESKIKQEAEAAVTAQTPNEIESAVAHNLDEVANAAAAKEKAKKTGDMPRSQNYENEKIKDGDDEIRRITEERRSIPKGETPTERSEREVKKVHQREKKNEKTRKYIADSRKFTCHA